MGWSGWQAAPSPRLTQASQGSVCAQRVSWMGQSSGTGSGPLLTDSITLMAEVRSVSAHIDAENSKKIR